ncbi:MAG: LruC domain-containing protein, partial [Bacteroidota bacterium]
PNLGSDPFDGFKIDNTSGIGDGEAGVFAITYTLTQLQDQQTSAKAGGNAQLASFTMQDFQDVMDCYSSGCGPNPDPDGDGCIGEEDEYPDDPERCYSVLGEWGTLAYEDLWPSKGDYDFNDVVIIYQTKMVYNSDNELVDIITDYKVTAVGASFRNGFAIQFDNLVPEDINSVTGSVITAGYASFNANGTEAGQDKAVVYVFDDTEAVINRAPGPFFNTLENGNIGTSDTTTISVYFNPPIDPALVGDAPFNPFLIRDGNRDIEIHLPDYEPTSLADPSYFGTSDDDSDPGAGRYYKSSHNLPWGIHIPELLDHMIEYIEIPEGYMNFSQWATSGGTLFQDWYKDLPGYRDDTKIWDAD